MAEGVETSASSGSPPERPMRLSLGRAAQKTYAHRFRAAYVLLAVLFWGAVAGGTIVYTRDPARSSEETWSTWKPTASGFAAVEQIAARVGSHYWLDDVTRSELALVHPRSLEASQLAGFEIGDGLGYKPIVAKKTLFYQVCGRGRPKSCELPGTPSKARDVLLRREALELALYTFKYVDGFDSIVVFLPTEPQTATTQTPEAKQTVVLFRADDVKNELRRPLRQTLALPPPLTPGKLTTVEYVRVVQLTTPHFFNVEARPLPDGTPVLVLDPVVR